MPSLSFSGSGNFSALPSLSQWEGIGSFFIGPTSQSFEGSGSFVSNGFAIQTYGNGLNYVQRYLGESGIPQSILRLRGQAFDAMRNFGQPVIVKHMFSAEDEHLGTAQKSPLFQSAYGQTRQDDPFSYGTGYCSTELSANEWVAPDGTIAVSDTQPSSGYEPAPKYRGYGQGFLTWIIEPDMREDIFRLTEAGALARVQDAMVQAPWFPEIHDNDLLINVILDQDNNIVDIRERFQAKQVQPITVRGWDKRGRSERSQTVTTYRGNRFAVNQTFLMSRVPFSNKTLYRVEVDR